MKITPEIFKFIIENKELVNFIIENEDTIIQARGYIPIFKLLEKAIPNLSIKEVEIISKALSKYN